VKNSIYRTLTILLLAILPGIILADDEDPLAIGKAAYEKGDFAGAIKSFKEAIKDDKKNPQGYLWLGATYLKADSLDSAIGVLVQARELDPQNPKVYELLGDVYIAQRVPAAGIDQYRKVLEFDKGNPSVWLKIGETSRKARQYNEAAEAYINVLLIDSTNIVAHRELAIIYMRAKQYLKALPLYRDLVKIQPDSLQYKISYVKILYETGYKAELIPFAEEVVQKDPSQTDTQNYLAEAYAVTGQLGAADSMFSKLNPDSLSAQDYIRWGKVQRMLEKYDGAIDKYERAYRIDSTLADIYYDLGTLYMKKKRYTEAVAMFDKKIAIDTTAGYQYASNLNAAMSLLQIKEYKRAKEYIENSLKYRPDNVKAWLTLAQCCGLMNNTACQSAAYQKVIEFALAADTLNGDKGKYKNELEEAYRQEAFRLLGEKKWNEAISYLGKALQYDPKNCSLLLYMGQAWHNNTTVPETKRWEEAKKYYCKVIQICPKSEDAKKAEVGLKLMGEDCQ
jgi:tetratricopeptide (TPR) repeat protein